jgi:hypothetical protein
MSVDYKSTVPETWRARLKWNTLPEEVQEQIAKFGLDMFSLGQHVVSDISEIKYDGRLIILEDGSRWEVDSVDASTSEFWGEFSKVVVIDGEMYNIEDAEKVSVQEAS